MVYNVHWVGLVYPSWHDTPAPMPTEVTRGTGPLRVSTKVIARPRISRSAMGIEWVSILV